MTLSHSEAIKVLAEAELLYGESEIFSALDRISIQITEKVSDKVPLVLCVLSGGLVPMGHLVTRLNFPLQVDYLHATRYRGAVSGGELHWLAKPVQELRERTVLIVDDILDEGLTLHAIMKYCREQGAEEVLSAVLVEKLHDRRYSNLKADFCGLEVGDRYVFGFGMDYKGFHRNLPGIYATADS